MRRLAFLLFILILSSFGSLSSQETSADNQTVIIKIKGFNEEVNMSIYSAFQNDDKLSIINSCDVLGLIVFAPKAGESISKAQSKAYATVKLNELKSEVPSGFVFKDELSAMDVLVQCREKMNELFNEETK